MSIFAKNLTEQDFREAADYFATQKSEVFCRVIQSAGVPKTYADDKFMRLPRSEGRNATAWGLHRHGSNGHSADREP